MDFGGFMILIFGLALGGVVGFRLGEDSEKKK